MTQTSVIYYFLGIALNNSWLLYRKHLRQMGEEATAMSLKDFLLSVAKAFAESGKILQRKRGRPSMEPDNIPLKRHPM
jgi:hypothetical protein